MNNIFTVAKYTFMELAKSRIFYVSLLISVGIVVVTFVASEFTYGVPEKVAIDFGLGALSFSMSAIAIFMGATLLPREIDSRTVYMVISRPISRMNFITGKILGLVWILVVNFMILTTITLISASSMGGQFDNVTIWAVAFIFLENILLLLLVVLLSLFVNNILASSIAGLLLLLGHAVKETQETTFALKREYIKLILKIYHLILPAFYKLNLKDFVIYKKNIDLSYLMNSLSYSILYISALFFFVVYFFNKKNLD